MGFTRPGKRLHSELENHYFIAGKIHYFYGYKWPFSIAMLVYQRVYGILAVKKSLVNNLFLRFSHQKLDMFSEI